MSNENTTKKRPTHRIYAVPKAANDNTRWTELGVAWAHKDGNGFQLKYNACPIGDCKIILRAIQPKAKGAQ
jgi:hypothetical protein